MACITVRVRSVEGVREMRTTLAIVSSVLSGALALTPAFAAGPEKPGGYPERSVSIIVPYGSGGGSDQVARAWSKAMQTVTGVPFQVENKPGGGGLAATPDFLSRPKDGYTILQQTDGLISAGAARSGPGRALARTSCRSASRRRPSARSTSGPTRRASRTGSRSSPTPRRTPARCTVANIGVEKSMEVIQMNAIAKPRASMSRRSPTTSRRSDTRRCSAGHADVLFEQPGDVRKFLEAKQMKTILTDARTRRRAPLPASPRLRRPASRCRCCCACAASGRTRTSPRTRRIISAQACKAAFDAADYQKFNKSQVHASGAQLLRRRRCRNLVKDMLADLSQGVEVELAR